jgi:prepilin-type N-terminal cleavage/methylation domain-containing protein
MERLRVRWIIVMLLKRNTGFTLVELSLALIIIGLIVSGILVGQALVKQAKLRSVLSNLRSYTVSFNAFELEYNAMPGDISNASQYWSGCVDATNNPCNGNNDKKLSDDGTSAEIIRYWQHLSLAGLIDGNYDGQIVPSRFRLGINSPKGHLDNSIYYP